MSTQDIEHLRTLAKRYMEIAQLPIQEEKRTLWRDHFSLKGERIPIRIGYGMWNVWCQQTWTDAQMSCEDPFYRSFERNLKMMIFQHEDVGDDTIQEPWLTMGACLKGGWGTTLWGVEEKTHESNVEGGARSYEAPLAAWEDMEKLSWTPHEEDTQQTARNLEKLNDAIGDILPINVDHTPVYSHFMGDISTCIAKLRGLETLMMDMYEYPDELHALLAFMRDGILANNQAGEDAGAYTHTSGRNQAETYADSLEDPRPNSEPCKRKDIWGFCAAQEYTLISPEFHNEFLFQYQKPIYEHFGLVHYGCCEDLTKKIDMLRQLPNLRSIAVTPTADVAKCAEQIGSDYAASWRPNPTDMVCCGYNEDLIRKIITRGLEATKGCHTHLLLKDVETVEGDLTRLKRWVKLMRELTAQA